MKENIEEQYDKIYRYCYYKVKNRDLAEDITQETFLRGIEAQGRGVDIRYLYRIAPNLCIDEFRRAYEFVPLLYIVLSLALLVICSVHYLNPRR